MQTETLYSRWTDIDHSTYHSRLCEHVTTMPRSNTKLVVFWSKAKSLIFYQHEQPPSLGCASCGLSFNFTSITEQPVKKKSEQKAIHMLILLMWLEQLYHIWKQEVWA